MGQSALPKYASGRTADGTSALPKYASGGRLSQSQRRAEALQPAPPSSDHRSRAITPLPSPDQRTADGTSALPKYASERTADGTSALPKYASERTADGTSALPKYASERTADGRSALPKYASGGRLSQSQRRAEALQPAPPSSNHRSRAITPHPSPDQRTADGTIRPPEIRLGTHCGWDIRPPTIRLGRRA